MADFDQIRQQLRAARTARDQAFDALAAAQERLKSIDAQIADLSRALSPNNAQQSAQLAQLQQNRTQAQTGLKQLSDAQAAALANEATLVQSFAGFSDPRQGIQQLNDSTPILMMPVRVETRFKTLSVAGAAAPQSQLWVRAFPDDCWIDTFDPVLTNAEVAGGKTYWTSIWQAGGIEDQEDAAWVALATSFGSGRASWIVQQYKPLNLSAKPTKPRAQDVILTIATEKPLVAAEFPAVAAFWRAMWLADGGAKQTAAASAALASAVSQARAAVISGQYIPSNFSAPLAAGVTKATVNLSVAQAALPIVDTRQSAWSKAPKAVMLPDRFVFLGYAAENDPNPVVALGNPVPSPLITGPDPNAPAAGQLQNDASGNLLMPGELKWMSDFDVAVTNGMGFKVNLTPVQASRGFKRVLVLGVRLNADAKAAQTELETLLRHHFFSRAGLAIIPQGTPTNNTDAASSAFSRLDDPNQSLEDRRTPLFTAQSGWLDKKDGQWLAEFLGVDPAIFANVHQAGSSDQLTARAMNTAMWPATLGYWMESMMSPVFPESAVDQTRDFFAHYVVAGGACPAIRIGSQPYGILPATTLSRMAWINQKLGTGIVEPDPVLIFLQRLYPILLAIDQDFRARVPEFSFAGKLGDPNSLLLDIVGLHPGSVEWTQRYAESMQTFVNRANLLGLPGVFEKLILAAERAKSLDKLKLLGYAGAQSPAILDLIFDGAANRLKGGVVDDVPLSETDPLRPASADGRNYIQWLIDAANKSLDAVYSQQDFPDGKIPTALLYLFLRHAVQLGYSDVGIRLYQAAGLLDATKAQQARIDDPFIHIRDNKGVSESRYEPLYAPVPAITGSATLPVHQFIGARLSSIAVAGGLRAQLDAMQRLKGQTTARLERAFADHIDCCSYRLDAWILGIVNYQLGLMRNLRDGSSAPARQGIFLGAYAWLEDLAPENAALTPVALTDPDLVAVFGGTGQPPLMRDSANQGYIHAPSLNHAVAAAVLRNGFLSNASPANRDALAVNLTSERVRTAMAMIDGIRGGQSFSDLLGYQFERGLHDRHNVAEADQFILKLRKAFPLRADRLKSTKTEDNIEIDSIEARNVINGLALVEHVKATNNKTYPFGITSLPAVTTQSQTDAINAEVDRLLETQDSVADLALSEGVYQAVLGNYDRVASTYDAYARGNFPPEPDVVRTPANGIGLTHRVALHLAAGSSPTVSPISGLAMTPRAQAEPALNQWIKSALPPLDQIACRVAFREAASGTVKVRQVTLRQIDLQPADLLTMIHDDNQQTMTELDDRISRFAILNFGPRPDVPMSIRYMEKDTAAFTIFEVMPLVRNLRRITTKSRPLEATDLSLMNEARSTQNADVFVDKTRLDAVRAALGALRTDLNAFKTTMDAPLSDLPNRRSEILSAADTWVTQIANLLARAAAFAIPQSGWGFAYDFRARNYAALLAQSTELTVRWDTKLQNFDARIGDADAAATGDEKFRFLDQADRAISTRLTVSRPPTPAAYRAILTGAKRPAFVSKRNQFNAIIASKRTSVSLLRADVAALLPVTAFDFVGFTLSTVEDDMVQFAQEVSTLAKVILTEIDRRLSLSASLFEDHGNSAAASDQVKSMDAAARALLGEGFRIFPEFGITSSQGDELDNALAASRSGELFQYLTAPPEPGRDPLDFPIDTWLYGVARVREKMFAWEQTVMFSEALGVPEHKLDALQLPHTPGDRWLAMEFPPEQKINKDQLLYTAHFEAPFSKTARQCGLLIDEWTETIPASSVDTGITFHYNRPNCEAPQAMLLVTPSVFQGSWRWDDLVGALNETFDFAKRRAIEPSHIESSPYAPFLPATAVATQGAQLTISLELALNNKIALATSN
jgi:hypothetical protein